MADILIDGRVLNQKHLTGVQRYARELMEELSINSLNFDIAAPKQLNRYLGHVWEHFFLPMKAKKYKLLFCPGNIAPVVKIFPRLVTTIHSLAFIDQPQSYTRMFRYYYKYAIPKIIEASDRIITVSETEKSNIIEKFPQADNKIISIYPGISNDFKPGPPLSDKDEKYIVFVGSLNSNKNIEGLLKAFAVIQDKIPHKLNVVGVRQQLFTSVDRLKMIIEEIPQGKIHFLGHKEKKDLISIYQKASLLVLPSFHESFGFPPLEAMACGCPALVSSLPSLKEVCGNAAHYVEPMSVESISDGIMKVLLDEDFGQTLKARGLNRVKAFNWSDCANKHHEIFKEVLGF